MVAQAERSLRSLGWPVYLPSMLYGVGQGAVVPIVVTSAVDLGASLSVAGLLAAGTGIGQLFGDVPSGMLVARTGEKRAMLLAVVLLVPALVLCLSAPSVLLLGVGVFVVGLCGSVWNLARLAYVGDVVAPSQRARAMSTLAGVNRIGRFMGPFAGAAAIGLLGNDGGYWVHLVTALLAAVAIAVAADAPPPVEPHRDGAGDVVRRGFRDDLPVLRTIGVAVAFVGALRASRQAIIPLWGIHIGLSPTAISIIYGVSAGVDMLLFYPGGQIMDRWGRRWVAVPSTLVLGLAHALLPLAGSAVGLTLVAMLMGLGNGISSGIVMTLGADLAPPVGRHQFLGSWRFLADTGMGLGPLALSGLIAVFSPAVAVLSIGALGVVTAWSLHRWIPGASRALP